MFVIDQTSYCANSYTPNSANKQTLALFEQSLSLLQGLVI